MGGAPDGAAWDVALTVVVAVRAPLATGLAPGVAAGVGAAAGLWHPWQVALVRPAWSAGMGRMPPGPWQARQSERPSNG